MLLARDPLFVISLPNGHPYPPVNSNLAYVTNEQILMSIKLKTKARHNKILVSQAFICEKRCGNAAFIVSCSKQAISLVPRPFLFFSLIMRKGEKTAWGRG